MSGGIFVVLPPTAAALASTVLKAGGTPIIDATGALAPDVPEGAWVRIRPGRPAPGTGPVLLAELGAPVPDRDTWLETTAPRDVPDGFAGLVLKGREAGGFCGDLDGLTLLANCPHPEKVILDAGLGPNTAGSAAALGAFGVLLSEQHLGCPEFSLSESMRQRLFKADDEVTHRVGAVRVANPATSSALRALNAGENPWVLSEKIWEQGDLTQQIWFAGQGLALARELSQRFGTLQGVINAYCTRWSDWPNSVAKSGAQEASIHATTAMGLRQAGACANASGLVGSGVLWQEAVWQGVPLAGEPLQAAVATGNDVVATASELDAAKSPLLANAPVVPESSTPTNGSKTTISAPPAAPTTNVAPEAGVPAVAIIGMGCRMPGAHSLDAFWSNITNGVSSITTVPADRWDTSLYFDEDRETPDKTYTKIGGFIKDFKFNSKRFRIPPKVARQVDPVQQITLESVADALEDANLKVDAKSNGRPFDRERCAVILGNSLGGELKDDYSLRVGWPKFAREIEKTEAMQSLDPATRQLLMKQTEERFKSDLPEINEDSMPGELSNVIAGRIANAFDLRGANFTVDAACASSMAAIQSAVKGLQDRDFDLVITGGADRSMNAPTYVKFCKIGALSPDHSAPFDASANGFVMGEGCGILVLKRYEEAVADGDKIYAVVRGIGASSDGKGKGITAPNLKGQTLALERAYDMAGFRPEDVDLFECHGTSTVVGDRVEIEALSKVIGSGKRAERGPTKVGSVKSMIGHLKSAAGAAALIKAAKALHEGVLPPSLGFKQSREDMPMDTVPFQVQTTAEAWPQRSDGMRRCGVSAFGFGGTNFHVVLENYTGQPLPTTPAFARPAPQPKPAVVETPVAAAAPAPIQIRRPATEQRPLPTGIWATSAQTREQLLQNLNALMAGKSVHFNPSDPLRMAAAAKDDTEKTKQLQRAIKVVTKGSNPELLRARAIYFEDAPNDGKLCMVFTGQGSQYLDMGLDLAAEYPIVQATFDEADRILTPALGKPITEFIKLAAGEDAKEKELLLRQTEYSQPATLTLDVAILRLLAAYGVFPEMVAGHSLGEYGAAVASGIMSFEQALLAVSARGREMASIKIDDPGKMAGIASSADVVEEVLAEVQGYVIAANKNCPSQTVIAGASDAVDEAIERFRARGITVYPLPVSHAFHSSIVAPASEPLRAVLGRLGLQEPKRPITTNVTAEYYPTGAGAVDRIIDTLAQQVAAPVEWTAQVERMYDDGARVFVECGPKRALTGFIVSILKRKPHRALYTNHPKRGGVWALRDSLAGLLVTGFPVLAEPNPSVDDLLATGEPRKATTEAITAHMALQTEATEPIPDITDGILRIVAAKTGYEVSDLDIDFELEADLGIDTVKQAEVFAVVRETYGIARDPNFVFGEHKSLRSVIEWAASRLGATRHALPSEPIRSATVPTSPPSNEALVSNTVVTDFLTQAAKMGISESNGKDFAQALLPAVQALLSTAFDAAKAEPAASTAPVAATPVVTETVSTPSALPSRTEWVPAVVDIVCSGASVGLPGGDEVFGADNIGSMFRGENRISHIGNRTDEFMDLGLVRLVKDPQTGQGNFVPVKDETQVLRLAGVASEFNPADYGIPANIARAFDITTKLAIAAAIEALRDAGIPLVRTFKLSASGKKVPQGWALPESMRRDTGIVFGSCFPGLDELMRHAKTNGDDGNGNFDRRFLFQVLSMGHSQLAQFIGAQGPNTQCNAACASTAQAVAIAEDWIKTGRCRRVIVVGSDNVTSPDLLRWIGGGFMAAGAASTHDVVEETALPFDRRRHGLVLGMGAAALVLESRQACAERGVHPIAQLLNATIVNSAYHGTRLHPTHIADTVRDAVAKTCTQFSLSADEIAQHSFFMSHETYTPARGGSAQAEVEALRAAFGNGVDQITVTNTKGYTGHPMGAGIEDTIAVKSLQYGITPPVANLREPDTSLGKLHFSDGSAQPFRYALRLAAGFGSQLAFCIWRSEHHGDARVADAARRLAFLKESTGYAFVEEYIENRTLRMKEATADALLPLVPEKSPLDTVPALANTAAPAPTKSAPAVAAKAPTAGIAYDTILNELMGVIAEKTGYETDELEVDFEMEADLGIDTVKQAEIFAELREKYGLERDDTFSFADYNTIEKLAKYLTDAINAMSGGTPENSEPAAVSAPQEPVAVAPTPAPTAPTPAPAAPAPAAPITSMPVSGDRPTAETILAELIDVIAEKTGYAPDELETDFELEADLGIDTVKQAEIFAELREKYGLERDDTFSFADYNTIELLAKYLSDAVEKLGSDTPAAPAAIDLSPAIEAHTPAVVDASPAIESPTPAASVASSDSDTTADLLAVISEKTGYETDELELDFELEADLGIDTVKQAEIFAELREKYGLERDDTFNFADYPTIEALIGYLNARRAEVATGPGVEATPQPADIPVIEPAAEDPVESPVLAPAATPEGTAAVAFKGTLPDPFRVRRPILVHKAVGERQALDGLRVHIIGTGAVADSLRTKLTERRASFAKPYDCVIDLGNTVLDSFHTAQGMADHPPKQWLTITRLGGFDRPIAAKSALDQGAVAGFTKALGREWEATGATVLDIDPKMDAASTASVILDEMTVLETANEIFRAGPRRDTVGYQTVPAPEYKPLPDQSVVLVTGGARGICAKIALEIAARSPATIILVGRSPLAEQAYDLDAEKTRIRAELKATGERVKPVDVERQLNPLRKANEALQTVANLRATGAEVHYRRVDMANIPGVTEMIQGVINDFGTIHYAIHGAGVEESRLIADKDDAAFHRVFDGKALGGLALVEALPDECTFVSMGSVAGRFGNPGQVDYSAANDALARVCLGRPQSLHIDWTAWDDVGMAIRGGMRRLLEDRGVDLLPADPGAALLVNLMAHRIHGELVVAGGLGDFFPAPSHPLLDGMEMDGDTIRVKRTVNIQDDAWIVDHSINGVPVLPGVIGLELMAAAAEYVRPGQAYVGAQNVVFKQPIKLHKGQPVALTAEAVPMENGLVRCVLLSERTLRTGRQQVVEHFSAEIILGLAPELDGLPSAFFPDESYNSDEIYKRFFHGPIFQVLNAVEGVSADALLAAGAVSHEPIGSSLITEPLILEAAFQAAGLHHMITAHEMALPSKIAEVHLLRDVKKDETLSITVSHFNNAYDVDVDGSAGGPILRLRGFEMATLGPLPPDQRFPVPDDARPVCLTRPLHTAPAGQGFTATARWEEDPTPWLTEQELHELTQRGTMARKRDRITGRIAAKRALKGLIGCNPHEVTVMTATSGEPIVLIQGTETATRVSISHRAGIAYATAVSEGRVGIDIEQIERRATSFETEWFNEEERKLTQGDSTQITLGWSAKEAILKALGQGLALSPRDIIITKVDNGKISVTLTGEVAQEHARLGGDAIDISWTLKGSDQVFVQARMTAA